MWDSRVENIYDGSLGSSCSTAQAMHRDRTQEVEPPRRCGDGGIWALGRPKSTQLTSGNEELHVHLTLIRHAWAISRDLRLERENTMQGSGYPEVQFFCLEFEDSIAI